MADNKKDAKAAHDAIEAMLNILPKTEKEIHNIAYTAGLICRDVGISPDRAEELIMSWSERLRTLPNFRELYPRYRKPALYKYQVRYAVQSAYKRPQDRPSSNWFRTLTGKRPPEASFWSDIQETRKRRRPST